MQSSWEGASPQDRDASLAAVLDPSSSTCEDPLAANVYGGLPCTYTCEALCAEYFPGAQPQATRCFLYDPTAAAWPEIDGQQSSELLGMRKQRFDTHTYISEADFTASSGAVQFTVGTGRECRNVTIVSTFLSTLVGGDSSAHTEEFCLLDGAHEYNHTIEDEHTVEVVGYNHSGIHQGAGGRTAFVVGECTDVLVRVTTTSASAASVSWTLNDGAHM